MGGRLRPEEIEKRSFEIIASEMKKEHDEEKLPLIMRAIHTSADFEYEDSLYFSEDVMEKALDAFGEGTTIITDTTMALSGINKPALKKLGMEALCFIGDEEVAQRAKEEGRTRSYMAVQKAAELGGNLIFVVGNAPTALYAIKELLEEGKLSPKLVIAVPVGFVNVVESKEEIIKTKVPSIVARGRKGGSNIAAALVNALLYMKTGRKL